MGNYEGLINWAELRGKGDDASSIVMAGDFAGGWIEVGVGGRFGKVRSIVCCVGG